MLKYFIITWTSHSYLDAKSKEAALEMWKSNYDSKFLPEDVKIEEVEPEISPDQISYDP